jgi:hypothetical protein
MLIEKYKIAEQDLYILGIIESQKTKAGFLEKEKLKTKALGILKPYNISFLDLPKVLAEIKDQNYPNDVNLVEKYGSIDIKSKSSSLGLKYTLPIIVGVLIFIYFISSLFKESVDPCKCSEVGANAEIIGYNNLSDESKKIFDDCESIYSTPADAYEDCVNKSMK